jgi:hypothetical protein
MLILQINIQIMSLVNRWDEESQNTPLNSSASASNNSYAWKFSKILQILGILILAWVILWLAFGYKVASISTLYIDNPTENEVSVKVWDLDAISIFPKSHQEIELKSWTYPITVNEENIWEITKWKLDGKAFLNPTKSTYIKETAVYAVEWTDFDDSKYAEVEAYGEKYYWPFEVFSDIYVKWNWTYGLDENLPNQVNTSSDETTRVKIYRYNDFLPMYEEYYYWYNE